LQNYRAAHATVSAQSSHLKNDSDNDVTRIRVTWKSEHDKRSTLIGENSDLRIDDDQGSQQKADMKRYRGIKEEKLIL
jgi:hypothetical protein